MNTKKYGFCFLLLATLMLVSACAGVERPRLSNATQKDLRSRAYSSLESLYASSPRARELQGESVAILVFPDVLRAGLIFGGAGGNGVLFSPAGAVLGYYNVAAVSFGLQAGAQDYSQAMFLTTRKALDYLDSSAGWSVGVGPTIVVVSEGAGREITTTTARSDVYAFIYGQEGLMGGLGLQGQKITKLRP